MPARVGNGLTRAFFFSALENHQAALKDINKKRMA
jgi:hypothetical protein